MQGLFFLAGVASFAGAVFTYIWIPITKDKSMLELETLFASKDSFISKAAEAKPELFSNLGEKYGLKWLEMAKKEFKHNL